MYKRVSYLFIFCSVMLTLGFTLRSPHKEPPAEAKQWVVVIDPGHGGKDPGCHGVSFNEKSIALAVSLKLGHFLQDNDKNIKVVYTRTTDMFVPLNERADIANKNHADMFICIHLNASKNHDANGSATYVMGLKKSEGNLEVEKEENSAILYEKDYKTTYAGFDPNSSEANILFNMYQNLYLTQSLDLSAKIQNEYSAIEKRKDNGVKQAGFLVLWKTAMPSLLTEIGFLTNPDEEKYLASQKGEDQVARSIFLAIEQYKSEKENISYNPKSYIFNEYSVQIIDSAKMDSTQQKEVKKDTAKIEIKKEPVKDTVSSKVEQPETDDTTFTKINNMKAAVASSADTSQVFYKVQFMLSDRLLKSDDKRLQDLPDIDYYIDNNTYKYTTGRFPQLKDAIALKNKLQGNGYKDAFVVAFKGKKRVTIKQAGGK